MRSFSARTSGALRGRAVPEGLRGGARIMQEGGGREEGGLGREGAIGRERRRVRAGREAKMAEAGAEAANATLGAMTESDVSRGEVRE